MAWFIRELLRYASFLSLVTLLVRIGEEKREEVVKIKPEDYVWFLKTRGFFLSEIKAKLGYNFGIDVSQSTLRRWLKLYQRKREFFDKFCLNCKNFSDGLCLPADDYVHPDYPEIIEFVEVTTEKVSCQRFAPKEISKKENEEDGEKLNDFSA